MTVDELWSALVTTSLLGTDRREPPPMDGILGDLVADTVRSEPSARMLAAVAACTAVRRAGVQPAEPADPLAPPEDDDRPACPPAAAERWSHLTASWPVLEDEWMLTLIARGWRLAPELVPTALQRHRRDPVRRMRVRIAAGPIASWLIDHLPELGVPIDDRPLSAIEAEQLGELPALPISPELSAYVQRPGSEIGGAIGVALEDGSLGQAHRAVLVHLLARCAPEGLADIAEVLDAVDSHSSGRGLATVLVDLATTRRRMLDELARPGEDRS